MFIRILKELVVLIPSIFFVAILVAYTVYLFIGVWIYDFFRSRGRPCSALLSYKSMQKMADLEYDKRKIPEELI